ncbi:hypothetical protein NDU88_002199 [Pleurodeles waltl]|uniref:Uncharacterized protein n=1 Tax=Pleurodeles waltl TaxID=8319 RepID=A0AAV7VAI1_PLEWA|nr:hypothetical protein NDU88_002199 [Pleurodeles waltl]
MTRTNTARVKEGVKNVTAAQEGSEEEIEKGVYQVSESQIGGSPSEADMEEETVSLAKAADAWIEEWYTPQRILESCRNSPE